MNIEIRDGKVYNTDTNEVAIIVSPGFGAGWSTWNKDVAAECLFDPDCVMAILEGKNPSEIAEDKWNDGYWSGADCVVEWYPSGTQFFVDEYDGQETIMPLDEIKYFTA